ncbi:MAG: hypothetical protein KDK33_13850, partial [Leptospiraceae bacterium]|nr:hypothetical protein [Leptospiraceae bacterium]
DLLRRQAGILERLVKELEVQRDQAGDVLGGTAEQMDGQRELARTMESLDREVTEINESAAKLKEGIERIVIQAAELRQISEASRIAD